MRSSRAVLCKAYDYVIVGGGSAGCVLANRLSADPEVTVCLLEAGPEDVSPAIHTPLGIGILVPAWGKNAKYRLTRDKLNWGFEAEEENGKRPYQPRGRCLGGSSCINALLYARGHKDDYDNWAALGNEGWSWEECLESFKSFEKFIPSLSSGVLPAHGSSGELVVEEQSVFNPFTELERMFFEASGNELGLKANPDYNSGDTEGYFTYQRTSFEGKRFSAARAFVKPVRETRKNLTVLTNTQVAKVNLDNKTATGVDWYRVTGSGKATSTTGTITANRRVILSAGALQTPQILQLSGIGSKADLSEHDIEVKHHLPGVGAHLLDHPDVAVPQEIDVTKGVPDGTSLPSRLPNTLKQYLQWRMGDWKTSVFSKIACETGYFYSTKGDGKPDIQGHFVPLLSSSHGRTPMKIPGWNMKSCLLYPKSEGYTKLYSKDPTEAPRIRMNFLKEEEDMQVMMEGVRAAVKMTTSSTFDHIRKSDCDMRAIAADEARLREYVTEKVETLYHPVGTCKMGNDDEAVVDSNLSVHGLQNLSVVDASIYPTLIGGNTNAPTMMVGDIGAKKIRAMDA